MTFTRVGTDLHGGHDAGRAGDCGLVRYATSDSLLATACSRGPDQLSRMTIFGNWIDLFLACSANRAAQRRAMSR